MHQPSTAKTQPRVLGRYCLYDEIAAGGMATVHFGRLLGPAGFSRTVAIKQLHPQYARDPEFVAMFLDEARLAARIRHPNVVSTIDVVARDGELFLVMEYIQGEAFARLLRTTTMDGDRVPPNVASSIVTQALLGLHAAHEALDEKGASLNIVHRDVSPQNILVGVDGVARVLDFGVAKATSRLQITHDGRLKGKLAYMAPEQLLKRPVDRRADVFAAATVLWEALCSERLFAGDDAAAAVAHILEGKVKPPSQVVPGLSAAVDAVVLKGLAKDPDQRFQTAKQMAQALEQALPPAGALRVSEWVEHTAGRSLKLRAARVAEIEDTSHNALDEDSRDNVDSLLGPLTPSGRVPAQIAALRNADTATEIDLSKSGRKHTPFTPSVMTQSSPVDLATGMTQVRTRRRRWVLGLLLLLAGATVVVVVLGVGTGETTNPTLGKAPAVVVPPREQPPRAPDEPAGTAPQGSTEAPAGETGASAIEPSASAISVQDLPRETPSPETSASAAPEASASAAPQATKPRKPPVRRRNCNPPYTVEADGTKRFKAECF